MKDELEALFGRRVDIIEKRLVDTVTITSAAGIYLVIWQPCMSRDVASLLDMLNAARKVREYVK